MIDDPGTREALTAMIYGMCLPEKQTGGGMKVHTVIIEGVVAELDGKYWGYQDKSPDGPGWDFGAIEDAVLFPEEYTERYKNSTAADYREKLSKARFVKLKKMTTYEVGIDPGLVVMR